MYGCTDTIGLNYNTLANTDDGTCLHPNEGCMDFSAINYSIEANVEDNSCIYLLSGCTNENYLEFNNLADFSDGSCINLKVYGCMNSLFLEFNPLANVNNESCEIIKVEGCNSANADNYNTSANFNDGSCDYSLLEDGFSEALDSIQTLSAVIESGVADPIYIDLLFGWSMIGYTLNQPQSVEESFSSIVNNPDMSVEYPIQIVKNVTGQFWWPEVSVNMLGDLTPGLGYMIYLNEEVSNFSFSEE